MSAGLLTYLHIELLEYTTPPENANVTLVYRVKEGTTQQKGIKLSPRVHALTLQWKNPQGEAWQRFLLMVILTIT